MSRSLGDGCGQLADLDDRRNDHCNVDRETLLFSGRRNLLGHGPYPTTGPQRFDRHGREADAASQDLCFELTTV